MPEDSSVAAPATGRPNGKDAPRRDYEKFRSEGIRANGGKVFTVAFTGKHAYELLHLLENVALRGESYLDICEAVQHAEYIRERLREQGF